MSVSLRNACIIHESSPHPTEASNCTLHQIADSFIFGLASLLPLKYSIAYLPSALHSHSVILYFIELCSTLPLSNRNLPGFADNIDGFTQQVIIFGIRNHKAQLLLIGSDSNWSQRVKRRTKTNDMITSFLRPVKVRVHLTAGAHPEPIKVR